MLCKAWDFPLLCPHHSQHSLAFNTTDRKIHHLSQKITNSDIGKWIYIRYHRIKSPKLIHSSLKQLSVSRMGNKQMHLNNSPHIIHPISGFKGQSQHLKLHKECKTGMVCKCHIFPWEKHISDDAQVKISFTHNPCRQKISTDGSFAMALGCERLNGNTVGPSDTN